MIIKLSGLDFSSNNIGSLGEATEISEFTKSVLTHYTKTLTTAKQRALDTFLTSMKDSGLWAKTENFFMPILAGTLSETMYNIKKNQQESAPGPDYYELRDQGLMTKRQPTIDTVIPNDQLAQFKVNGSYMNLHYMVNTAPITWSADAELDYDKNAYWLLSINSSAYKGIVMEEGSNNRWNLILHGNPRIYVNPMTYPRLVETYEGTSIVTGRTDKEQGIHNNILGNMSYTATEDKTMTDVPTFVGTNHVKWEKCHLAPMRIFGTGYALSDEELKQYTTLCNNFVAAFNAE